MTEREIRKRQLESFASEHGMTVNDVHQLLQLANRCGRCNTYWCNGDPHTLNQNHDDKNENSRLWAIEFDDATAQLQKFVDEFGFGEVEYNGLYPTLKRNGRDVYPPYGS